MPRSSFGTTVMDKNEGLTSNVADPLWNGTKLKTANDQITSSSDPERRRSGRDKDDEEEPDVGFARRRFPPRDLVTAALRKKSQCRG